MTPVARPAVVPAPIAPVPDDAAPRAIPFDHSFRFNLDGRVGSVLRTTVTVSIEAYFTAVSIGYGVVPEVSPVIFGPRIVPPIPIGIPPPPTKRVRDITLGDLFDAIDAALKSAPDVPKGMSPLEAALRNGIKLNADFAAAAVQGNGSASLNPATLARLFQVVSAPVDGVQFLYALFDEGSGREFQSDPILNIAGLGASDGGRPFRYFARPIVFAPMATIRMDVTQISDFRGELHVALHGYKMLRAAGTALPPRDHPSPRRMR